MRASLKTLCVDDNATNLKILQRTLKHHFSHIVDHTFLVTASDGWLALDAWRKDSFELILLDIDMPNGLSGVDVAREIRKFDLDVIIIACTTSDSPANRELYEQVGMDGCVCKPIDLREMNASIKEGLANRRHLLLSDQDVDACMVHASSLPRVTTPIRPRFIQRNQTTPDKDLFQLPRIRIERSPFTVIGAHDSLTFSPEESSEIDSLFATEVSFNDSVSPSLRRSSRAYSSSSSTCACTQTASKRLKMECSDCEDTRSLGVPDTISLTLEQESILQIGGIDTNSASFLVASPIA